MPVPKRRRPAAVLLGLAAILAVSLSGLLSPRPAPRYTVTDLGVLPGYADSRANAVNGQGAVAGTMRRLDPSRRQACVYQQGKTARIGSLPGETSSDARGINAAGDITGYADLSAGHHAFLYSGGRMRDLGTLPGFSGSEGVGINDGGEVTGNVTNFTGRAGLTPRRAFFYSHGRMTALGLLPGFSESDGRSINAAGQIAGVCYVSSGPVQSAPFLYDSRRKTMTALPLPPPYREGFANHVNERGQVAGSVSTPDATSHAALWDGGRLTDLGSPPGYDGSIAQGLNDRGEVVGRCFRDDGWGVTLLRNSVRGDNALRRYLDRDTTRAFVYRDGKMQDLNELIPQDSDWTLENARGINDRGQIVGQGLHHGQERGFLLTPLR